MNNKENLKYKCLCYGQYTLPVSAQEAIAFICPVCWRENDVFIKNDNESSDENHRLTSKEVKENYKKFGKCDK